METNEASPANVLKSGDVLLLDIEGTVCPIIFVKQILFPYARNNLKSYLEKNWEDPDVQADVELVKQKINEELKNGDASLRELPEDPKDVERMLNALSFNFDVWMERDKKYSILKKLQGRVYANGFESGIIKSQFYHDVAPTMRKCAEKDIKICTYSSGSVEAQRLVFGHTQDGDLTPLISEYYDTSIGLKIYPTSYEKIPKMLNIDPPSKILFLTDMEAEAEAAVKAGLRACIVIRPGNEVLSARARKNYLLLPTLDQLIFAE